MLNFVLNALFWTLALYGFFEIIQKIVYEFTCSGKKGDNTYVIIAVKNGEDYIEGSLRSTVSKIFYEKDKPIKEIIVVDLNSSDSTSEILNKIGEDNENIKIMNWKECKDIIDNITLTNS